MKALAPERREDRVGFGIVLALTAFLTFSFIDTSVKWLAVLGIPAMQLAFMRYAGHFVMSVLILIRSGSGTSMLVSDRPVLMIVRGLCLALSTVMNFIAIQYLPLTLTSTILFLAPIIVCAVSWPLLGERVGIWRFLAILVGFGGVLIAIQPTGSEFHWSIFASLLAAIFFAFYQVLTRKLTGLVATDTLQFYTGFVGTALLLPFAIFLWKSPETVFGWTVLCGLGLFGFLGHEFLTRSYRYAEAYKLSPFAYSFMIYVTLWSFLFFGQTPDTHTVIGAVIVVASGLFIWMREQERVV